MSVLINPRTNAGYWDGDRIVLTGESSEIDGGIFHKAVIKEGHRKGEVVEIVVKNVNDLTAPNLYENVHEAGTGSIIKSYL